MIRSAIFVHALPVAPPQSLVSTVMVEVHVKSRDVPKRNVMALIVSVIQDTVDANAN